MSRRRNPNLKAIGNRVREERVKAKLTQDQLAKRMGIGTRSVNGYEAGRALINSAALLQMRDAGLDAIYVLFGIRMPPGAQTGPVLEAEHCPSEI